MTADPKQKPEGPSTADFVSDEPAPKPAEAAAAEAAAAQAADEEEAISFDEETLEALDLNEGEGNFGSPQATTPREAELEAQVADTKDQLVRALAETENLRNRARREKAEALKYAAAPLAKDLLSVADNLKRALAAVPTDAVEQDPALKTLLTGVEMTDKALGDAFAKHGIVPIDPIGEKLDPHRHEAMIEIDDPTKPAGTVAQVYELGWLLGERLLRPARVAVAKGGPKAGTAGGQENDEPPEPGSTVDTQA
ncbi:nucleotide exchange factor GrpE [Algihabitans albus]|uniref:nucleotide exchange factor GrpE n=1 Tax=Algihabitans albus TaxID=2164067 RepID=UPI000E5C7ACE|nr:nucleotide exchange factor GrpE [Algihabitans albus]